METQLEEIMNKCERCGIEGNYQRFTILGIPLCEDCLGLVVMEWTIKKQDFAELAQ
jgi:hypothetical protein